MGHPVHEGVPNPLGRHANQLLPQLWSRARDHYSRPKNGASSQVLLDLGRPSFPRRHRPLKVHQRSSSPQPVPASPCRCGRAHSFAQPLLGANTATPPPSLILRLHPKLLQYFDDKLLELRQLEFLRLWSCAFLDAAGDRVVLRFAGCRF